MIFDPIITRDCITISCCILTNMQFTDPESFEKFIAPIGGEVNIRPMKGSKFRANIDMRPLTRVAMFAVESDSFLARKATHQGFYALNIPLNVPFAVSESGSDRYYGNTEAYMLSPDRPFTFKCKNKCNAMACNIFVESMGKYRDSMLQETTSRSRILEPRVSLISAAGNQMFRSIIRAWVALRGRESPLSEVALKEMEDDILASLLMMSESSSNVREPKLTPSSRALSNVEDYISANIHRAITRDNLCDVAGISIRSLSRTFTKKYGVSPISFVRQRRFEACFRVLYGSDREETTVTNVALAHGFDHLGRFSVAYKKIFGESPSETLFK